MFDVWVYSHTFPNTQAAFLRAARDLRLPFVPVAGLRLQFGAEDAGYEFTVEAVAWDVARSTFTLECGTFETPDDTAPVPWHFYQPGPLGQPATERCPHDNADCDCPLLYETEALVQFLRAEGWTVEISPAWNPPSSDEGAPPGDGPK